MENVDDWSKMAFLQLEEALCLLVGLEPVPFHGFLDPRSRIGISDIEPLCFMKIRHQQFARSFDPNGSNYRLDPMKIDDWAKRVDLETHRNFREILKRMIAAQGKLISIPDHIR